MHALFALLHVPCSGLVQMLWQQACSKTALGLPCCMCTSMAHAECKSAEITPLMQCNLHYTSPKACCWPAAEPKRVCLTLCMALITVNKQGQHCCFVILLLFSCAFMGQLCFVFDCQYQPTFADMMSLCVDTPKHGNASGHRVNAGFCTLHSVRVRVQMAMCGSGE